MDHTTDFLQPSRRALLGGSAAAAVALGLYAESARADHHSGRASRHKRRVAEAFRSAAERGTLNRAVRRARHRSRGLGRRRYRAGRQTVHQYLQLDLHHARASGDRGGGVLGHGRPERPHAASRTGILSAADAAPYKVPRREVDPHGRPRKVEHL
jgi:hypothetical protein